MKYAFSWSSVLETLTITPMPYFLLILSVCGCDNAAPNSDNGMVISLDGGSISDDMARGDLPDASVTVADSELEADALQPDAARLPDGGLPSFGNCAPPDNEISVHGRAYIDNDDSDRSTYTGGAGEGDSPLEPMLTIHSSNAEEIGVETCEDGSYRTDPLSSGTFFVQHEIPEGQRCTTTNCPGRFARKIAAGETPVMLTFGDSIAVVGDAPIFPERVRTLFSGLTDIDNRNMAIAGTTSEDWRPTGRYFMSRLTAHLEDADLIVITIGGNDVLQYVGSIGIPNDIPAAVEGARAVVRQVVANVAEILSAIRMINPDADIAYCLYADYSQATGHPIWGLVGSFLGPETVGDILRLARDSFPTDDPNLILIDMFGAAQGLPLHDYLYDQLHFNDRGQSLYAEEVFTTLGGVLVGPSPLGETGASPLGLRRHYGVSVPQ
jgi:lysophospholipase L1-like esterase